MVVLRRLVTLKLVASSPQPREVGLFPGTGCMVSQPFTTGGNRPYPEVLGGNRQPAVPEVNYLDKSHIQHIDINLITYKTRQVSCP
jgi:hypothetical protein